MEEELLKPEQVYERFKLTRSALHNAVKRGRLVADLTVGTMRLYKPSTIQAYLDSRGFGRPLKGGQHGPA